jgi:hypothetical protein
MNNKDLIEICYQKYHKEIIDSWDDLALKYNFKSGEALRCWFKNYRKSLNDTDKPLGVEKEGEEEIQRVKVDDCGDYYIISSKKRSFNIDKSKIKKLKFLYCDDDPLTINELCRQLDIPRRDFMLVKSAFNITHDDVPYLDEELDGNLDSLVDESLERKKEKYFIKLQQRENNYLKEEIKKYRNNDYLYDKMVKALSGIKITVNDYNLVCNDNYDRIEALLDLADMHIGIKTNNYWNQYSIDIAKQRFEQLTCKTIQLCKENNVSKIHVSMLGDAISGIIHETLRLCNEVDVITQVQIAVECIAKMLLEFSIDFDVVYADVTGNHGRVIATKDASLETENFEKLIGWGLRLLLHDKPRITFEDNYYDEGIIVKQVSDVLIFESHGHQDKFDKIASDFTMMLDKPNEIHMGHYHHSKSEDFNCVKVYVSPSFCGVEDYSKGLRKISKACQTLYIYQNGKRKYIADIELK